MSHPGPVDPNDMTQAAKRHRAALNGAHSETARLQSALLALEAYWAHIKDLEERLAAKAAPQPGAETQAQT